MVLGLPPMLGFIPLAVFIILMLLGKNMVLAVLTAFLAGALLTGAGPVEVGTAALSGLSSFLGLIGFIVMLGSGLGEILTRTNVAPNIVRIVITRANIKTQTRAILVTLLLSTMMTVMLGTMTGANALLAPIVISVVASMGITRSTLGVILHGGGAVGLMTGPFVPQVASILQITGLSYGEFMRHTGIPFGVIMLTTTFLAAKYVQKRTQGITIYGNETRTELEITPSVKRGTAVFLIGMVLMIGYGLYIGGGAPYAIVIMLVMTFSVGIAAGMTPNQVAEASMAGFSRLAPLFFTFSMFYPLMNFILETGALQALALFLAPAIEAGGQIGFMIIITIIGIFGLSGAAVAHAAVIHYTFGAIAAAMGLSISIWTSTLMLSSQLNTFAYPGADMIAQMGLARSKDVKAMMCNGMGLTIVTFAFVLIRGIIFVTTGV